MRQSPPFDEQLEFDPDDVEAHCNLGAALIEQRKLDEAIAAFRRAISIQPDHAEAHYNIGVVLAEQGKLDEARAAYRQAIDIRPDYAEAHSNLGKVLVDQGKLDEAIAAYRQSIVVKPSYVQAYSNLAFCVNFQNWTPTAEHAAHHEWHERFGRPVSASIVYANEREAGRRLKIGYVSPNFREHSIAFFLEPLLEAHDRQVFDVFCYAEVPRPDAVTARLKGYAGHWLGTVGLSDDAMAERIRMDGIDILVDLAGHTANNRLGVFARKPAPVQVAWLGYPNTTGLQTIDYRLVDAVTDPVGEADACASETLVRLNGCFLCYAGSRDAPEPATPPGLTGEMVTFGSFNNPAKLSPATLDAWGKLLAELPQARLLLKGKPFADAATRALFLSRLSERAVAAERVELVDWLPSATAHLELYNRIDIALDPFPYNGTTTTCEALWMGVPVVTLRGDRHRSRVGASLLTQAGLTDRIAGSLEEYLEIATALAADPDRLRDLRRTLRPRLAASALCDGPAFARKIEATYRAMWQHWCKTAHKPDSEIWTIPTKLRRGIGEHFLQSRSPSHSIRWIRLDPDRGREIFMTIV